MYESSKIVRATVEQARAFATLGLLRLVTESTPTDLVCTYILRSRQSWGLKDRVREINKEKVGNTYRGGQMSCNQDHIANRIKYLPEGIIRMTKDYLIRQFWKNIHHLTSYNCMHVDAINIDSNGHRNARLFPKELLRAISAMHVNQSSRIWDLRHEIGTLHALCAPDFMEQPKWLASYRSCGRSDRSQFDAMSRREEMNIEALNSVFNNYYWQISNRQHIPNDAEKNILLNFIETFLIMFGPGMFHENFLSRQIYEYCRVNDIYSPNPNGQKFERYRTSKYDPQVVVDEYYWTNGIDQLLNWLKHLSPEAALCTGFLNNDDWDGLMVLKPDTLKSITPNPYREVSIYLKTEMAVQRQKTHYAKKIMEAVAKGEFDREKFGDTYWGHGKHSDAERCYCCEPASCCDVPSDGMMGMG